MSPPKERPILFSAPMVRALLAGTKTQTRRIVKPQPEELGDGQIRWLHRGYGHSGPSTYMNEIAVEYWCPHGKPGDHLWVKETGWQPKDPSPRELREGADTWPRYAYDADGITDQDAEDYKAWGWKRRPSIFMPRSFSRITLEITGVRVERLQDISDADAIAEGVERPATGLPICGPRTWYRVLWESINGAGSWEPNPWVWVVSFKRLEQPQ